MKYTSNTIKINYIFIFCIALLFCAFIYKLSIIALNDEVEGTNLKELAESRSTITKKLTADRGRILDSQGNLLAQNVNSYTVIAYLSETRTENDKYPKHVKDKEMTATKLAEILEPLNSKMTKEYILGLLNTENVYQVELGPGGRNITELTKQKIEELTLPGIDFIKTSKRYYQNGDFASYIIGYAKKKEGSEEMNGELGIEGFCNNFLKGKDGSITYQQDAYGYKLASSDVYYENKSEDGYDVYLTLDKQIQIFVDNAIHEYEKSNPEWVSITIADAKTGAIVGSSSSPSFDPNKLNITNYNNPLTSYTYEPGSTMKIFSFMSAIEEGEYKGDEKYSSGTIAVGDYTIKDWNKVGWGSITFDTGFTYSSNVAAVKLSQRLGKKKLHNYYQKLGFGSKTGIELSNEYLGDIDFNYESEIASASYGQGVTITPIQMIKALTTITNDGTVLKPYVIDKIVNPNTGEIEYEGKRTELEKIYSTSTVNKIIELMDLTVNGSDSAATGKVYASPNVRLIGKTGTANYTNSSGTYVTGSTNVIKSFAGVFPKENPEYIIYAVAKDYEGSSKDVGNIIKKLVESISKYKNLDERNSDKNESKIITVDNYLNKSVISVTQNISEFGPELVVIGDGNTIINQYPKKGTKIGQNTKIFLVTNSKNIAIPNMVGWSSGEVIDFCNLAGIKYNLNGYGYVVSYSVNPGDIVNQDIPITFELQNINPSLLAKSEEETDEETIEQTE